MADYNLISESMRAGEHDGDCLYGSASRHSQGDSCMTEKDRANLSSLSKLVKGSFFGEDALVMCKEPWLCTMVAGQPCTVSASNQSVPHMYPLVRTDWKLHDPFCLH
jgi:hypothetical protein